MRSETRQWPPTAEQESRMSVERRHVERRDLTEAEINGKKLVADALRAFDAATARLGTFMESHNMRSLDPDEHREFMALNRAYQRADNALRLAQGLRPQFKVDGGTR